MLLKPPLKSNSRSVWPYSQDNSLQYVPLNFTRKLSIIRKILTLDDFIAVSPYKFKFSSWVKRSDILNNLKYRRVSGFPNFSTVWVFMVNVCFGCEGEMEWRGYIELARMSDATYLVEDNKVNSHVRDELDDFEPSARQSGHLGKHFKHLKPSFIGQGFLLGIHLKICSVTGPFCRKSF